MFGIAGVISRYPRADIDPVVRRMMSRTINESSHQSGVFADEHLGISGGWFGTDNTSSEYQPVWNDRKDICLLFLGEEYPRAAARGTLPVDARDLISLYERRGDGFCGALNGWFCGIVLDLRDRKVVLFNDRFGLRRIYYYQADDGFYFASEAKALLAVRPQLRALDPRGLGEFLSCGCVLQNRSLFPEIFLLPGGARWTFRPDGTCRKESYFSPAQWENQAPLAASEYPARLAEVFQRVLPPYLDGSAGPVGMSLTGGIDSRLILAWAKPVAGALPCYTFGGPYRDCADVRLARRLAHTCGLAHQTIRIGGDFLREFPSLAEQTVHLSDGTMDVSGAAELYANRRAREIAPVRLTGNYGSEILRSIVAFRPGHLDESVFSGDLVSGIRAAEGTYAEESRGRRLSFIAFKQVPWHHYARLAVEQSQLTVRSPYLDNELVQLAFQAPPELASSTALLLRIIAEGNPALAQIGTDRAFRRRPIPVASWIAHRFQEFTVKAEYAYDYGMPQRLARMDHVLRPLKLERLFLGRHKFLHFRVWYRDGLADHVRSVLLDPATLRRPYVNGPRVEQIVTAHVRGTGNYTREIHKLLTLELVQRELLGA